MSEVSIDAGKGRGEAFIRSASPGRRIHRTAFRHGADRQESGTGAMLVRNIVDIVFFLFAFEIIIIGPHPKPGRAQAACGCLQEAKQVTEQSKSQNNDHVKLIEVATYDMSSRACQRFPCFPITHPDYATAVLRPASTALIMYYFS